MTTLILGHSRHYKKQQIRCSPIDVKLWYDKPFKCVDFLCDSATTDFVYDIYRSIDYRFDERGISYGDEGFWVWKFAEDESYDIIIDCIGSIYWDHRAKWSTNEEYKKYKNQDKLLETILRVLKINGKFYSYFGIYTKTNDKTLLFERKKLDGYKYIDY